MSDVNDVKQARASDFSPAQSYRKENPITIKRGQIKLVRELPNPQDLK